MYNQLYSGGVKSRYTSHTKPAQFVFRTTPVSEYKPKKYRLDIETCCLLAYYSTVVGAVSGAVGC